jgi:hypothetical protein
VLLIIEEKVKAGITWQNDNIKGAKQTMIRSTMAGSRTFFSNLACKESHFFC